MTDESIEIKETKDLSLADVLPLYESNDWSSAQKPELLLNALRNSHSLVTAWHGNKLIGLANAISDNHLVVYFPHLLVHPEYQRKGIGRRIMNRMCQRYEGFHQQMVVAEEGSIEFYQKLGFAKAGKTQSMWKYEGKDH